MLMLAVTFMDWDVLFLALLGVPLTYLYNQGQQRFKGLSSTPNKPCGYMRKYMYTTACR